MSYDDNICPCGSKTKPPGTMLCDECVAEVHDDPDYCTFLDRANDPMTRRFAAIRVVNRQRGKRAKGCRRKRR